MTEHIKVLFVDWCAKDALEGTQLLEPMEELAYRRILDFIYSTNDKLPDDDKRMARLTKTGRQWKTIKQTLIDFGKIEVKDGFIRNKKCTSKIELARKNIAQKKAAGEASAQKRKSLKENESTLTAVDTDAPTNTPTAEGTAEATNHKPIKKKKINKKRKETPLAKTDTEPPDKPDQSQNHENLWFEGRIIRLNEKDFKAFESLHGGGNERFMEYLLGRDEWYASQAPSRQKTWFMATKNDLQNRTKQEDYAHA